LSELLPFLPLGLELICLQKDIRGVDKKLLAECARIKTFSERLMDFTDTAALCELMDIVVTVDTSVAHLSGTLGKSTLMLLPFNPDWRWLLDREDSPWYPTLRLLRQEGIDDWGSAFSNLRDQLPCVADNVASRSD
jgi:ADP-heptose:LPS heptosyltransferase